MEELRKARDTAIEKHPQHKEEIEGLYELALTEIESGESPQNELSLFVEAINQYVYGEQRNKA
jgi:hypothetical protein